MISSLKDISSRRGVYSGLCVLVTVLFFLIQSSVIGVMNNTTNGTINAKTAFAAHIDNAIDLGAGGKNTGDVINGNAGNFVHLTNGTYLTLLWVLLAALSAIMLLGVVSRLMSRAVLPGLAFIVALQFSAADFLSTYRYSFLTDNVTATVAVLMGVSALAIAMLDKRLAVFNKPPSDASSISTGPATAASSKGGAGD